MSDELMTTKAVSKYLGVTPKTVKKIAERGHLKVGKKSLASDKVWYTKDSVESARRKMYCEEAA
jgi:hypothetical protein